MAKTLEQLCLEQEQVILRLQRIIPNTKKIGQNNYTVVKIENRKEELGALWKRCQEKDLEITTIATDDQMKEHEYFKSKIFQQAEEVYYLASDFLAEILEKLQPRRRSLHPTAESTGLNASTGGAAEHHGLRLTRINPPKFSGNRAEWENFRDLFNSLVIENASLSNVERMHFLKTSLTGEAEFLLRNIKIAEANFTEAWKQLNEEFENKQLLINTHLQAVFDIPVMKLESANALRSMRDIVNSSIAALNNLQRPTDQWDDMLIYVLTTKLPYRTRQEWQMKSTELDDIPTFKEFIAFITKRLRGLEDNRPSDNARNSGSNQARGSRDAKVHSTDARENNNFNCPICSGNHWVSKCNKLLQADIDNRYNLLKRAKCCTKCLRVGHASFECRGKIKCFKCDKAHHTILHRESNFKKGNNNSGHAPFKPKICEGSTAQGEAASSSSDDDNVPKNSSSVHFVRQASTPTTVLLPTALVALRTAEGRRVVTRALIDQCSTYSFITDSLSQSLKTRRIKTHLTVNTFGEQYSGTSNAKLQLLIESINGKYSLPIDAYVYRRISAYAASKPRVLSKWPYLEGLELADPTTNHNQPINLLIGSDIFGAIILDGLRKGPLGSPIAQLTIFGWILSGPVNIENNEENNTVATVHTVSPDPLNIEALITRFWETEEVFAKRHLTNDEEQCETHFRGTHSRNSDGRYIVRLPFKETPPLMGDSINIAKRQYLRLEKRLESNPELSKHYHEFLAEYSDLGHMEPIPPEEGQVSHANYLPHHPVIRESSSTTKLRVVFNASCRTSNGTSLNDHLLVGPKLQTELPAIIMKWRLHKYVLTADINKMFRQILVHPEDCDYQRILWRIPGEDKIYLYRLLTVTYGTASAPYLSIRVLQQLAEDEGDKYPLAKSILQNNIYVDDVLFGANSSDKIEKIKDQLDKLLSAGGFHLRKWASNKKRLLENLPHGDHELAIDHPLQEDDNIKILGISWAPLNDSFLFNVSPIENPGDTKRQVLSTIARLFDPLGWATPIVVSAKIIMQEIWLSKCQWDDKLPSEILQKWQTYCHTLPLLSEIRIPRWLNYSIYNKSYELHGFCDASEHAYAAAVYLRVETEKKGFTANLIAAKSKVAPLKTLSIPRLELCAAVILVRLMEFVANTIVLPQVSMYCWTDSTVVLDWIVKPPSTWKTFIANRVSEIQTKVPNALWNHVPSASNPADCASRGITTAELLNHKIWWNGPRWLRQENNDNWPIKPSMTAETNLCHEYWVNAEMKRATVHTVSTQREPNSIDELPNNISQWRTLLRVTAYVFRLIANFKARVAKEPLNISGLKAKEINEARLFWIKRVQNEHFSTEIRLLREAANGEAIKLPHKSPLICLSPFLENDIIRLGGRLKNAPLSYNEKYPIVLPKCRIAQLIIDNAHMRALHAGPQLTLRTIRQNFWILGARRIVRTQIRSCVTCAAASGGTATQKMGDLPDIRVNPPIRAFLKTGVDYAGPFHVLPYRGRGQQTKKSYIAVFVCLATRAIHLELAMDYETEGFLKAFQRFVSRRGIPSKMYSDNGTNFVGADRKLTHSFRQLGKDKDLSSILASDGTTWKFIPAASPHFGGLWEAGVKSVKHHLRRIVGDRTLSIEEFNTLLCQIEACLNSRPICAMTSDPNDYAVLTPGHFLIGAPITTVPDESVLEININRLSRYQQVRAMYEHFWRAWSHDYLHTLQTRNKWLEKKPNIKENSIVLLKNNLLPPCKWELARVIKTFPGKDNLVRVVQVKTAKSTYKRSITQICPLPINTE